MIKNIIILILGFLLSSLLYQGQYNVDIIKNDISNMTEMMVDGAEYLHKTIDETFEIHSDEKFKAEHGTDRDIDESLKDIKKKIRQMERPVA